MNISVLSAQLSTISLLNANGQQVKKITTQLTKGDNYFQLNSLKELPDGVYYLSGIINNKLVSKKLIIGL